MSTFNPQRAHSGESAIAMVMTFATYALSVARFMVFSLLTLIQPVVTTALVLIVLLCAFAALIYYAAGTPDVPLSKLLGASAVAAICIPLYSRLIDCFAPGGWSVRR